MAKRIVVASLILGFLGLMLAGCMQLASLSVAPTSAIVEGGGTVTFTATDHLGNPVAVTWSVASGPGSITSAGVYTAPPAVTAVTNATVTASRVDRPAITASATVTIKPPIPPITATLVDGLGDTFAGPPYDVASIRTSRTSTTLTVVINFTTTPTIPPAGNVVGAGDIAGFICFDTDENAATGWPSANYFLCPCAPASPEFGVDYFIHLFSRNALGNYDVISTFTGLDVGDAVPSVTPTVLTLTIPLTELGADDGITNMNSVLGDDVGPTDCVPDEVAAVVTAKDLNPKIIIIEEEYPYYDFLSGLEITGEGWLQTRSFTL